MPGSRIGSSFPHVVTCSFLARAPEVYLKLSRFDRRVASAAAGAFFCTFADPALLPRRRLDVLPARAWRTSLRDGRERRDTARSFSSTTRARPGLAAPSLRLMRSFVTDSTVDWIVARINASRRADAPPALETIARNVADLAHVAFRGITSRSGSSASNRAFSQSYHISLACVAGADLVKGVHTAIVDKDRNPAWRPDTLEGVTPDIVERHFRPLGALELKFEE